MRSELENNPSFGDKPKPYEYALMSEYVNTPDDKTLLRELNERGWKLIDTVNDKNQHYTGMAWKNKNTRQLVIAHKGVSTFDTFYTVKQIAFDDVNEIIKTQSQHAIHFTQSVINKMNAKTAENKVSNQFPDYTLSFTGHAIGGYHAIYAAQYFYRDYQPSALVFDAPGTESMEERVQSNLLDARHQFDFSKLPIINYLSPPNIINTCNKLHGRLIHIFPKTKNHERSVIGKYFYYHLDQIDMKAMREQFDPKTGEAKEQVEMADWPVIKWEALNGITTGASRSPIVEAIFGVAKGVDAVIGLFIGVLEDIRNNTLSIIHAREDYIKTHQYLDDKNDYREKSNLTKKEKFEKEVFGKYRVMKVNLNKDEQEILTRELHPSANKFLNYFSQYPLLERHESLFTSDEFRCLTSFKFENENTIVVNRESSIDFVKIISRLAFAYCENKLEKYHLLKEDISKWEKFNIQSYVIEMDRKLEHINDTRGQIELINQKSLAFESTVGKLLNKKYELLKINRTESNDVEFSTSFIPRTLIENIEFSENKAHKTRYIITGVPGSGKSTLSKYITKEVSEGRLWSEEFDIVFLINANEIKLNQATTTLAEVIFYQCFNGSTSYTDWNDIWKRRFLNIDNKILYILDGFDENSEININGDTIPWFKDLKSKQNVIITTRTTRNLRHDNSWKIIKTSSFNKGEIQAYFDKYSSIIEHKQNIKNIIQKNNELIESIKIPIYLEITCSIIKNGKEKTLTEIYDKILNSLLRLYKNRIDKASIVNESLSEELRAQCGDIIYPLKDIAANEFKNNQSLTSSPNLNVILRRHADILETDKLRQKLIKAHFISTKIVDFATEDDTYYEFVDKTMQQFIAALYLTEKLIENDEEIKKALRQCKNNPDFKLIFLFIAGLLGNHKKNNEINLHNVRKLFFNILDDNIDGFSLDLVILKLRCLYEMSFPPELNEIREVINAQMTLLAQNENPQIKINASIAQILYDDSLNDDRRTNELANIFLDYILKSGAISNISITKLKEFAFSDVAKKVIDILSEKLGSKFINLEEQEKTALIIASFNIINHFNEHKHKVMNDLIRLTYSNDALLLSSNFNTHKTDFTHENREYIIKSWVNVLQEIPFDNAVKIFSLLCNVIEDEDLKNEINITFFNLLNNAYEDEPALDSDHLYSNDFKNIIRDQFVNSDNIYKSIDDYLMWLH